MGFGWFSCCSSPAGKAFRKGEALYNAYKTSNNRADLNGAIEQYAYCLEQRIQTKEELGGNVSAKFTKKLVNLYFKYSVAAMELYVQDDTLDNFRKMEALQSALFDELKDDYPDKYAPYLYNFGNTYSKAYMKACRQQHPAIKPEELFGKLRNIYVKALALDGTAGDMTVFLRRQTLVDLGNMLLFKYNVERTSSQGHGTEDLDEAIAQFESADKLFTAAPTLDDTLKRDHRNCLNYLATAYLARYEHHLPTTATATTIGNPQGDLNKSIQLYAHARSVFDSRMSDPIEIRSSHNYARALYKRYVLRQYGNEPASGLLVVQRAVDERALNDLKEASKIAKSVEAAFRELGTATTDNWGLHDVGDDVPVLLSTIGEHINSSENASARGSPSSSAHAELPLAN